MNYFLGKSEYEFWQIAENWYARTHRLREVWQDETKPIEKRIKATLLWAKMSERVFLCVSIAKEISKPKPKLEKGSIGGTAIISE